MEDLIKALQIIMNYIDKDSYNYLYPIHCEHDILYVCGVNVNKMDFNSVIELNRLGFIVGAEGNLNSIDELTEEMWNDVKNKIDNCCHSYKYGSC